LSLLLYLLFAIFVVTGVVVFVVLSFVVVDVVVVGLLLLTGPTTPPYVP